MGKVLGEGWVVGVCECGGCARGGEAVELRGQVVELFLQAGEGVGKGGGFSVRDTITSQYRVLLYRADGVPSVRCITGLL